jgi:hypothetical protein
VTKELGQGAYGIVWYALAPRSGPLHGPASSHHKQHVDGGARVPGQHD